MEIVPSHGRRRETVVKEEPDLIIVSDNLPQPPVDPLDIKYNNSYSNNTNHSHNNNEPRVPSVTFSPLPPQSSHTPSSFNHSFQTPEEIQVEPAFEYYQNGDDLDCSSGNENYSLSTSSLYHPRILSGGMNVTQNNQYGQKSSSSYTDGYYGYYNRNSHHQSYYEEPEEDFISIDDIKAKPFLFKNMSKRPLLSSTSKMKKCENHSSDNNKKTQQLKKLKEDKTIDLVIIDDDDDDDDNDNDNDNDDNDNNYSDSNKNVNGAGDLNESEYEEKEEIINKKRMDSENNDNDNGDDDDDVILIEDDEDEMIDENEVGEELDWMAFERGQEQGEQDKQTYECFLCNKKVASNYNLRRHMMIHTGERPFGCDICLKRFREFSDLKKHRRVHCHEKEYKCMVCKKNAPSPTNPTKCEECNVEDRQTRAATSSNVGDLLLGEVPCIEGSDKKAYICPVCDRIFGSRHNLKRHFMIHTGEKPYKCDICEKAFREVSTLKKHMLTHSRIKLFKCTQCGREYSDFSTYTRHKNLSHPNQLNFGSLSNGLTSSSSSTSSSKLMTRGSNFVIASVTSADGGSFSAISPYPNQQPKQQLTQQNKKPSSLMSSTFSSFYGEHNDSSILDNYLFQCKDCFKKFTNASIYKEHMKLHSRDFTFQCYICKKMFRTKEKLNSHFVTHEYDDNNDLINDTKNNDIIEEKHLIQQ